MTHSDTAEQTAEVKPAKVKKVRVTMAQAWGECFAKAAVDPTYDKAALQTEMIQRFPEKEETVLKWTDWYKNFYNMGKIKGYENPVKVNWTSAEDEAKLAARAAKKAEKEAAKEIKRQEKALQKEQARQEKQAAREAATVK